MLEKSLLLFFIINFIKKSIDSHFVDDIQYEYKNKIIHLNEILFSAMSSVVLLFMYFVSLMSESFDLTTLTMCANIIVSLLKISQYKINVGEKISYGFNMAFLISTIRHSELNNMNFDAPLIYYAVYRSIIFLIPMPIKNLKLLLLSKSKINSIINSKINSKSVSKFGSGKSVWFMVMIKKMIVSIDDACDIFFAVVAQSLFCFFIYQKCVSCPNIFDIISDAYDRRVYDAY